MMHNNHTLLVGVLVAAGTLGLWNLLRYLLHKGAWHLMSKRVITVFTICRCLGALSTLQKIHMHEGVCPCMPFAQRVVPVYCLFSTGQ